MKITTLLLLLLMTNIVSAVTISEGVIITTENATWNVTRNISLDNISVGNNYLMFENDNISLSPDSQVNISINNWISTSNHEFSITGAANIPYEVTINGVMGAIKYNGTFYKTTFASYNDIILWTYNFDRHYNIAFYDEGSGELIDFENVTIDFIGLSYSDNFTTENGTLNVNLPAEEYLVRFSGETYQERFYELDVTNYNTGNLNLYMISKSNNTNVTITVIDQFVIPVSGASVKALKYDIDTNTYLLQEISPTNSEGKASMHLTLNNEYYKFIVVYNDDIKLTTNPTYITSSLITLQIVIGEGFGDEYYHFQDIDYNLTYNDLTNNFRYTWNDATGISNKFCLKTYRQTPANSYHINTTCVNSAAGTILHPITPINGSLFVSKAYYTNANSIQKYLGSIQKGFSQKVDMGKSGLIIQLLLTISLAFIAVWSVPVAAIITPLSLVFGSFIGLNSIGYEYLIPAVVVGIIIAYITSNKS